MDWQFLISTVLVVACALYALRGLLPRRLRFGTRPAVAATTPAGACGGCSGCGAAARPAAESVIRIVPRQARPGSAP